MSILPVEIGGVVPCLLDACAGKSYVNSPPWRTQERFSGLEKDLNSRFGERARAFRTALGLSLVDLTRDHGLDFRTFSALERGARRWKLFQIEAYCTALGVEPWQLFKWDEPLPEPRSAES